MKFKRLIAGFIDLIIISFIILPVFWTIENIFNFDELVIYNLFLYIIFSFLFFSKDLTFKNMSIGKRIFKLKVLTNIEKTPSAIILFLRNVFLVI